MTSFGNWTDYRVQLPSIEQMKPDCMPVPESWMKRIVDKAKKICPRLSCSTRTHFYCVYLIAAVLGVTIMVVYQYINIISDPEYKQGVIDNRVFQNADDPGKFQSEAADFSESVKQQIEALTDYLHINTDDDKNIFLILNKISYDFKLITQIGAPDQFNKLRLLIIDNYNKLYDVIYSYVCKQKGGNRTRRYRKPKTRRRKQSKRRVNKRTNRRRNP